MISGFRLKVCGLTTQEHAEFSAEAGAEFLGFNLYHRSPRYITLAQAAQMAVGLKTAHKVAVVVEPSADELKAAKAAGFDYFQVHFRHDLPLDRVTEWSEIIGAERLWLAPKLPPSEDVPTDFLPLASTFLLDTFDPEKFGGTGRTGDWAKFAAHQETHPELIWVLSGGLNAENVAEAVQQTGATFIDVNSGVETSPGVKDRAKLKAVVRALTMK